jgi:hypothetical protein
LSLIHAALHLLWAGVNHQRIEEKYVTVDVALSQGSRLYAMLGMLLVSVVTYSGSLPYLDRRPQLTASLAKARAKSVSPSDRHSVKLGRELL